MVFGAAHKGDETANGALSKRENKPQGHRGEIPEKVNRHLFG